MNSNQNLPLPSSVSACVYAAVDVDFGIMFLRLVVLFEISKILGMYF